MTVKELCKVISPYLSIQVGDSKTSAPIGCITYLADGDCNIEEVYGDYEVYAVAPKIDNDNEPFLAILLEMKV